MDSSASASNSRLVSQLRPVWLANYQFCKNSKKKIILDTKSNTHYNQIPNSSDIPLERLIDSDSLKKSYLRLIKVFIDKKDNYKTQKSIYKELERISGCNKILMSEKYQFILDFKDLATSKIYSLKLFTNDAYSFTTIIMPKICRFAGSIKRRVFIQITEKANRNFSQNYLNCISQIIKKLSLFKQVVDVKYEINRYGSSIQYHYKPDYTLSLRFDDIIKRNEHLNDLSEDLKSIQTKVQMIEDVGNDKLLIKISKYLSEKFYFISNLDLSIHSFANVSDEACTFQFNSLRDLSLESLTLRYLKSFNITLQGIKWKEFTTKFCTHLKSLTIDLESCPNINKMEYIDFFLFIQRLQNLEKVNITLRKAKILNDKTISILYESIFSLKKLKEVELYFFRCRNISRNKLIEEKKHFIKILRPFFFKHRRN